MRQLACLLAAAALAAACASAPPAAAPTGSPGTDRSTPAPVTIGVGPDAETQLLGAVMVRLLDRAGIGARVEQLDDRSAVRKAIELGAVDVVVGYTGEAWLEVLGRPDPSGDARTSYREVRDADADRGLIWMRPTFAEGMGPGRPPADATFAFFVQGAPLAGAPPMTTMTEFASRVSGDATARVCVSDDFGTRPDGLSAVWRAYSVDPDRRYSPFDPRQAVRGVAAGDCLAGLASATSGEAWGLNLRPLIDDRRVFPAFVVTPVVREEATQLHTDLLSALNPLPAGLTTRMLGEWNARVVAGEPIEEVAAGAAEVLVRQAGG